MCEHVSSCASAEGGSGRSVHVLAVSMGVSGPVDLQGREMIFSVILHGQLGLVWPPAHLVCVLLQACQSPSLICERDSGFE